MRKKDGHTHTIYSHHGSQEQLSAYLDRAIELGFDEYVVTEHAPLPAPFLLSFNQPEKARYDSALYDRELKDYQSLVEEAQAKYGQQIKIKRGFEVDYFADYEDEIQVFLEKEKGWWDEIVLSVHFLPDKKGDLAAIDYDAETFEQYFGPDLDQPQQLFARYFQAIEDSIRFADRLGIKVRVGHLTLIRIYQKRFDLPDFSPEVQAQIDRILALIKAGGHEIDYNAAGFRKKDNGESYPTAAIVQRAKRLGIPLVYGSDAHQVADLGLHYEEISENIMKNS
ncbi:histidinol-phosphatase HisJ [Eupransor demetentiae]|uniref:Histidinol-phosphatase n=1 Tax=Eupransor demetentiae TaxID=3109584 RepID=A0ABM9N364_9LACO|nr:Histidinol phosphatase or related hydrolase of the PHP family (HIS2) [Lactobacillaceae bacterium LMG 33000]